MVGDLAIEHRLAQLTRHIRFYATKDEIRPTDAVARLPDLVAALTAAAAAAANPTTPTAPAAARLLWWRSAGDIGKRTRSGSTRRGGRPQEGEGSSAYSATSRLFQFCYGM